MSSSAELPDGADRGSVMPTTTPPPGVEVVASTDLFKGATELRVRHRGDEYRLRITRQGKLILTK